MIIGIYLIAFSIVGPLVLIFWLSDLIDRKNRDRKHKKMAEQAAKENALDKIKNRFNCAEKEV